MTGEFLLNGVTTAVGSLPGSDAAEAVKFVFDSGVDIPFWPQLPARSFFEGMVPQYSEGLPFARVDEGEKRIWCEIPDDRSEALTAFYEKCFAGDVDAFAVSPEYAAGLHIFLDEVKSRGTKFDCLKGQVAGPVTMTLGIADQNKRAVFYDAEMREAAVKLLAMKARSQVRLLAPYCKRVMIFLDEPILAGFGTSAYLGLSADDVVSMCNEIIEAIHDEGAVAGVHCCSNTDWSLVMSAKYDVVNFDAYGYAHTVALYTDAVRDFLGRGGVLAWGIVPTTDEIDIANIETIWSKLEQGMQLLVRKGFAQADLRRQCLLTPSCGAGGLRQDQCKKVFDLLAQTRERLNN